MADFGVNGMGGSLRDALAQIQALGGYNVMAPPALGGDQPSPPVPLPQPRPVQPVPLPPGGVNMPMNYPAALALQQQLAAPASVGPQAGVPGSGRPPGPAPLNYGALLQYAR